MTRSYYRKTEIEMKIFLFVKMISVGESDQTFSFFLVFFLLFFLKTRSKGEEEGEEKVNVLLVDECFWQS